MELVIVRGTPEEIRSLIPDVDSLWADGGLALDVLAAAPVIREQSLSEPGVVPDAIRRYIADRARPGWRPYVDQFAAGLVELGAVLDIGRSQRTSDGLNRYFMAYAPGPRRFGAALYVHPTTGRVDFHLQASDLADDDREAGAFVRDVAPGHPYAITVMVDGSAKVESALRLASRALEAVGGEVAK